ncbi:unnamed protein product [Aureobasidium pullulans]|nr:unnamed protein product [Aureobasidium pullulans]CAD0022682.1 unnamed protein product [Aureobasidium pullulans]
MILTTIAAIIQDCEDSLTNWVEQNAAVTSSLSTRTRTLSQRRRNRHQGEAVDLAHQDAPMENRDSNLWIPASQHHNAGTYEDDDEEEDASVVNGSIRGRDEERVAA